MGTYFTEHARTRMQQRGIPAAAVDLLIDYGKSAPAGEGCELVFFDKAARPACPGPSLGGARSGAPLPHLCRSRLGRRGGHRRPSLPAHSARLRQGCWTVR
jgi:hypothetical protein